MPESSPAGLPNYDELTLPQLPARLRPAHRSRSSRRSSSTNARHADRSSFTGMLSRRIANARKTEENGGTTEENGDGTEGP